MKLVQQTIIRKSNPYYKELESLCHKSKNLYNKAIYTIRQQYKDDKSYLNYALLEKKLRTSDDVDYRQLPTDLSQQTLRIIDKQYASFFAGIKSSNVGHKVSVPNYLDKNGKFIVVCPRKDFSKKNFLKGFVTPAKSNIKIEYSGIDYNDIQQIRFIPKASTIVMEVVYNKPESEPLPDNNRYLSIDLGLKNLATCTTNVETPFIINGRPLCSINQFYNKKKSDIQSELQIKNKKSSSEKLINLTNKRNNKIKDYLHKSSRYIIDYAAETHCNTIIIGKNNEWKQDINIGHVNNQKFVQIPHSTLINMIRYKAKLKGINIVIQEESYTSKCSFIDKEEIRRHESYKGKRTTTKLFKNSGGSLINADVNGGLNIMRKGLRTLNASDDVLYNSEPVSRGFVANPVKINIQQR